MEAKLGVECPYTDQVVVAGWRGAIDDCSCATLSLSFHPECRTLAFARAGVHHAEHFEVYFPNVEWYHPDLMAVCGPDQVWFQELIGQYSIPGPDVVPIQWCEPTTSAVFRSNTIEIAKEPDGPYELYLMAAFSEDVEAFRDALEAEVAKLDK